MRLGDDVAQDIVKEAARARLEAALDAALAVIKRRTRVRDYSEAITEVRRSAHTNSGPTPSLGSRVGRGTTFTSSHECMSIPC